jgi:hypothetical protein
MNSLDSEMDLEIEIDEKKEYYKPEITQISLSTLTLGGGSSYVDNEGLQDDT